MTISRIRPSVLILLCTLLAAPASAQKIFDAVNENPPQLQFRMTGAGWFAHKRANAAPVTLTAAEFLVVDWNAAPSVTLAVGIWDENPATGGPRNLLGSGQFVVPQDVPGWYGAVFTTPVQLPSAGNYFVAIQMPNAIAALTRAGNTPTPYWFGGPTSWTGPVTQFAISFRVYAGTHAGLSRQFDAAKPGSRGLAPQIEGAGWPNTANPFGFRMTHAAIGVPCLFVIGQRTRVVLPIAVILATPLVTVAALTRTDGTGRGDGFAELTLAIPDDPALAGGMLAAQVLVLDPGATFGIAHTQGLEVVIGN